MRVVHPDVLRSPHFKFAMAVLDALEALNWHRFFRLVASAPYLLGAAAHSYFDNMRSTALKTLARVTKLGHGLPLQQLQRDLLCDSLEETLRLVTAHGFWYVPELHQRVSATSALHVPCSSAGEVL